MQRALVSVKPLLRRAAPCNGPQLRSLPRLPARVSRRCFVNTPTLAAGPRGRKPGTKIKIVTIDDKIAESFTLNEKIETRYVQEKTPDNKLSEPKPLAQLLREIDRSESYVLQLSKPGDGNHAIVQVVQRKDLIQRINSKETAARQSQLAQKEKKPKQIELNWAISGNDLQLKMKQLEDFLRKGKKVELLLAARKYQRKATQQEAEELLRTVQEKLQEIGATEVVPMQGAFPRQATITAKIP
ncbi:hypothetical protein PV08_02179 [Exophiala spinifera]|uniref:Translation initiation factor 3 C-terminal domain-containing protein n=1 Tax=Exophiala spinifera TaxID=91928 RepID=A0A0D2CDJ0_9EURO|nr:uncharacterized protein PV08_02179 [Exophiala spinifera]KIW21599.1 hypothetical protein PV08_02179 [Exophiala spinifera]